MNVVPWFLKSISLLFTVLVAAQPPQPISINITGTNFLDHDKPISSFWGQTFLKENIPYIDIPNSNIQDVYYYRWSSLQRHLRYTIVGTGYILTEFMKPPDYAEAFGTIDAAAGHQIDEARWLRSKFYNDDYIQAYTRGPGNSTQYTHWILDAMFRRSQVTGDSHYATEQLADMARLYEYWNPVYDSQAGLFYFTPNFDAQEYSLPGYIVAPGGGQLQLDGPNTYRPNHNAYMVANARAVAQVAVQAGDSATAATFTKKADQLEQAIYDRLWDPSQNFFVDVIMPNNPNLTKVMGREEVGFFPYRFGIGLTSQYANTSVQELFDPQGFLTAYGPTTLEVRNQYFTATKPSDYCCYWQGQSWPFSTAHTLKSLAAIYRSGNTSVTAEQYVQYLGKYATTQYKNGTPYVAESHYPEMDAWSADTPNHSEHYDHSTNNDDVLTGLLGIVPRSDDVFEIDPIIPQNWTYFAIENLAYHGHLITVLYDQDGTRYNNGTGLSVFLDGSKVYNGNGADAQVAFPATNTASSPVPVNIAANPNGNGSYPQASATYTYTTDDPYRSIDGYLFYDSIPDNRWTNYQSPNTNDTLQIVFARPRNISSISLALFSDVARGGSVDVPAAIEIHGSSGLLANLTSSFLANDRNTFYFAESETTFVSVNMYKKPNVWVGICELEIWTQPQIIGPYYAVDAFLTDASVSQDTKASATTNGAVASTLSAGAVVAFSGIQSAGGNGTLILTYANGGSDASVEITVNQVSQGNMSLPGTIGSYTAATMSITLAAGKNFVNLIGGTSDLRYELLDFTI
ncbi:uncharacterized protein PAC_00712 [Phialocephala subalpina]|uniref:Uncharacterized protein n=1 Tax=Phialocephala subalpina TaxID=576137 RepID=A0A1L7WDP8_9HELO|nr:uncharacterized protein PAC_00712 [Phialocephala subalpina]